MTLEQEFQSWIEAYGFSRAGYYCKNWIDQVKLIHTYWDYLIDDIDKEYFRVGFVKSCSDLNLAVSDFDINHALNLCKTDCRIEFMTLVADRIVKWSLLSIAEETRCVKWSGQEMMLQLNLN